MKKLASPFNRDGHEHTIVKRDGLVALIEKRRDGRLSHEVVVIQERAQYEMMGTVVPAHEAMPGNEEWGTHGFSMGSREDADAKFDQLVRERGAKMKLKLSKP